MSKFEFDECSLVLPLKVKTDCIHDANGRHVAEVCTSSVGRNDDENEYFDNRDRKRAVYIAKCVNAHEILMAALSALVTLNDTHSPFGGEIARDRVDHAWDDARAALAKTEAA